MRFLSVLLIGCILFLSGFAWIDKTMQASGKKAVCHKMMTCKHALKNKKSKDQTNDCDKQGQGCSLMLMCSICGFLKVEPLTMRSAVSDAEQSVTPYKSGIFADYHPSDWKPPKAC